MENGALLDIFVEKILFLSVVVLFHEALHLVGIALAGKHVESVKPAFWKRYLGVGFRIRLRSTVGKRHLLLIALLPQLITLALLVAGDYLIAMIHVAGSIEDMRYAARVIRG